ncbi:hypothetical protein H4R20_001271 [Coemansia guatemalensis]|uniref:UBA domain-containing protein n=1 Tax=Coemansia guatemalensis TaxID=2761395 RepID=A0A9W8LTD4_9FUNG|nr:hypothetical protein H4R20_001271 [Coemansia guatemalensis]
MSELVQGVKLKFELPFQLPAPVSFPLESIGDFQPITRIPKYDYSLEKKIMKDIAKQRQEDQFNMLRQAQQQLSMVDLIASRKNRHKGKEPERKGAAVGGASGKNSSLAKPSSESGVSRLQGAEPAEADDSISAPETEDLRVQKQAKKVQPANAGIATSASASSAAAPPDKPSNITNQAQAEQPHSVGADASAVQSEANQHPNQNSAGNPQHGTTSDAASAQTALGTAGFVSSHQPNRADPAQYQVRPYQQPQHHPHQTQASQQGDFRPANGPIGFAIRPNAQQFSSANVVPSTVPSSGPGVGPVFSNMAGNMSFSRPQMHVPPQQAKQQQPIPPPVSMPARTNPSASLNPRFSTTFGMGLPPANSHMPPREEAPARPSLPPKPDEWKPQPSSMANLQASDAASSSRPPTLPSRNQNLQDPAAPAIPPKPFAFSEFDYAADETSGTGPSDSSGHVEQLNTLLSMGFSRPQAIHALEMYDYDVNKASNYLIDKQINSI